MYDTSFPPPPPPPPIELKRPVLGIVSFVIAVVALIIFCGDILLAFTFSGSINAQSYAPVDTVLTCMTALMSLVGIGLGIAAVVQKNTKKVFGILGLVFNSLIFLGICGLIGINLISVAGGL